MSGVFLLFPFMIGRQNTVASTAIGWIIRQLIGGRESDWFTGIGRHQVDRNVDWNLGDRKGGKKKPPTSSGKWGLRSFFYWKAVLWIQLH